MSQLEMRIKEERLRCVMEEHNLEGIALTSIANFAWATCGGGNVVGIAAENGVATVLFTKDGKYLICDNIESGRIEREELRDKGFIVRSMPWYEAGVAEQIERITCGAAWGSDTGMGGSVNVAASMDAVRKSLTPDEIDRYRWLGSNMGECMSLAAREIKPGMTEHEIASVMNKHIIARGITPIVTLIATDERISNYRHPVPTDKKLDKCAMLVTGGRKWGLIISATRLVHFGEIDDELRRKHRAVAAVDAAFIANSLPGAVMSDIFNKALQTYADTGFSEEWKLHHQGGPTGYKGREFRVNPATQAVVAENQAFAWNPSITGTKSEDTIIATGSGPEILSLTENWPLIDVEINGVVVGRPDILIR